MCKTERRAMTCARPSNVILFERLMCLAIAIAIITTLVNWSRLGAASPSGGSGFVISITAVGIGIRLVLVWLAARHAKDWARRMIVFLFGLGLISEANQLTFGPRIGTIDSAVL